MLNLKIFNKISTEVLTLKNDLELNSEIQLITKYKTSICEDYKKAIVLIFKERGYTSLEVGQLLDAWSLNILKFKKVLWIYTFIYPSNTSCFIENNAMR